MRAHPRFPPSSAPPADAHPLETAALVALAALAAVAVALWATGMVAGRIFGGAWPHVGAAEMAGVVVALADTPGDPARAWPEPAGALIPGPVTFYGTLALLLAAPLAAGTALLRRRERRRARRSGSSSASRWAKPRELHPLRVTRPEPGRLTLGRAGGRLLAAEPRQSVIVVGPTQTLKTTGFAIPAILEWQGPVLATSVKSDLLRDTLACRASLGDAFVYDPTGATGVRGTSWTPLAGCVSWQGAQRTASWLAAAHHGGSGHGAGGLDGGEFWYATAAKLLAPTLFAAATSERTMADVVRWVDTQEEEEVREALEEAGVPAALAAAEASWLRDPKTRSGVYTTAETVLGAYADPRVLASAQASELSAVRLLDGSSHTAYVCAPAHEQRRLRPLLATLVQEIVAAAFARATQTGRPLDPPLLLVLDEAANIAPLRDLDALAATAAAQGIQLVTVFQDLAQVHAVYGRERAATIVSNHRAKVVLSGISDPETLELVGRLLGDEEVRQVSSTVGGEGQRSSTESVAYRSLAPANVLREMRPGEGLLVYGHLPPARISLRPWFKERGLRRLTEGRVSEAAPAGA